MSDKTNREATHLNFVDHIGAGLYYFIKNDLAFTVGYRLRHVSNMGIKYPNSGVDSESFIVGASFFY
jgi:hypothetical protein